MGRLAKGNQCPDAALLRLLISPYYCRPEGCTDHACPIIFRGHAGDLQGLACAPITTTRPQNGLLLIGKYTDKPIYGFFRVSASTISSRN
ncbi:hypothetical protein M404DRAFT_1004815 [Pisolithus tinctorius Marx 270]|uniref:Uncharacterized protein n=1 Tax=Pisolithus tinctorius Marx 270 TaxID=870435 RepID=A0A0C3NVB2_PISTI|nr:hypothetical protein M404DRAFT_1004815 [Pisolithus tinctorius Marx 270]